MKLRSFYSVLVGVVLALLLAGGLGAVWLSAGSGAVTTAVPVQRSQQPSPALTQPAAAANSLFISRQAPMVVSLLSNPTDLANFWLSGLAAAPRQTRQAALESLSQNIFAEFGLDYGRDLKSWLGNQATFAVMTADIDRDPQNGSQPGYLLVLAIADPQQAEKSVEAFWQRQAGEPISEQVAGVELRYAEAAPGDLQFNLASAMVASQYLLFANDPKVLRTALNNAQVRELSLEQNFSYQQALEQLTEPQLGFVFVNIPELAPDLSQKLAQLSQLDLSDYDSLMLGLRPVSQGLLADAVLLATHPTLSQPDLISVSPLLRFVPIRSRLAIVSRDLAQLWQRSAVGKPDWQQDLIAVQQKLGLAEMVEPEADFLQGDFVLAKLPHLGRADDWLLVVEQSPELTEALAELDRSAQQQGMSLGSFQLAEQTVYAWTKLKPSGASGAVSLQAEVQALRTQAGNYELVATSLEALEQALSESGDSLGSAADFKVALQQLRSPNQGYLYLDRRALERRLQPNRLVEQLLQSFQSGLVTRYSTDETGQRAAAFWRLVD